MLALRYYDFNSGIRKNTRLYIKATVILSATILLSCRAENRQNASGPITPPVSGTWKLLTGTLIEKGDTTLTDYTKDLSFIKIINDSHFAFLQHNPDKKDSARFVAGGGSYSFIDSSYTEHLQYCSAREWEGNDFTFTFTLKNDTLTLRGLEKVEGTGMNRINVERYVRVQQ